MHSSKNQMMFIGSSYNLNNIICEEPVVANGKLVSPTDTEVCLGVKLDENLSLASHIDMICKKASSGIGAIKRIKPFVPAHTLESIYKSLVQPYFDYCSPLWDTCVKLLKDKLYRDFRLVQQELYWVPTMIPIQSIFSTCFLGIHLKTDGLAPSQY